MADAGSVRALSGIPSKMPKHTLATVALQAPRTLDDHWLMDCRE